MIRETRRLSPRTQQLAERFERLSPANKKMLEQIPSNLEAVQDAARRGGVT